MTPEHSSVMQKTHGARSLPHGLMTPRSKKTAFALGNNPTPMEPRAGPQFDRMSF